ncbi:LLM class flavin-dependent oxidoreductase [uncultured Microbacterium sp.]|uniref:LLM class flavin-dependent oxidoreductase n=1 Tax=uncultured Microbacterium sp. TaxID=191216 RepID=UPI0025F2FC7E|nr:LLM class flavin-dependent oxidoreductase [uncultured Microbacterium sp.]
MTRLQHFGWFLARGFGPQGWGSPALDWDWDWTRPEVYQQGARELERAGFDFLLIEDAPSLGSPETIDVRVRHAFGGPKHDPLLLAPYLFAATTHLGVIPTVNPAGVLPYTAARQLATLQHLSGDRLGINVVTDVGSARHFGAEPPLGHDAAYDRAEEWLAGVRSLWRSWDAGALIADRETGVYADGSRLRPVAHRGEYYAFDGPLNAVPFVEGEPVIASPGGSGRGLGFAGANSDIQLALAPMTEASVKAYRAKIHDAAVAAGREASDINILFAVQPTIVASAAEADRLVEASLHPDDDALAQIARRQSSDLETDLTGLDLDAPLPERIFGEHVSQGSVRRLVGDRPVASTPLRDHLASLARLGRITTGDGFVATAEEFADFVEVLGEWGNDGLLLWGDFHPVTLHRTLDELVPILRRRGLLRREYAPGGLRANLRAF